MSSFNELKILSTLKNTSDSVILSFEIPENLKNTFCFEPGQYITLEKKINNTVIRRPYSICSSPDENWRVVGRKSINPGTYRSSWCRVMTKNPGADFVSIYGMTE